MNKWRFTEFMVKAGYTQISFSKELGVSKNTLNNKLNGRGSFSPQEIKLICEKLRIDSPGDKCEIFLS